MARRGGNTARRGAPFQRGRGGVPAQQQTMMRGPGPMGGMPGQRPPHPGQQGGPMMGSGMPRGRGMPGQPQRYPGPRGGPRGRSRGGQFRHQGPY